MLNWLDRNLLWVICGAVAIFFFGIATGNLIIAAVGALPLVLLVGAIMLSYVALPLVLVLLSVLELRRKDKK